MRVDREGRLLQQLTIWLPAEMVDLLKADGLNISRFIRDQIAFLYSEPAASQNNYRDRLVQSAQESLARHRAAQTERDADVERARAAVRLMRADREAAGHRAVHALRHRGVPHAVPKPWNGAFWHHGSPRSRPATTRRNRAALPRQSLY